MLFIFLLAIFLSFCLGLSIGVVLSSTGKLSCSVWRDKLFRKDKNTDSERKMTLSREQRRLYQRRIESYLQTEQPYLNTDFRMRDMVEATGIPRHHLSMTVNTLYGTNFNNLINRYRIRYVLSRFDDPAWNHLTLEGVAEEAGFNSRTTFLNAFKKVTGMTPSKFRKQLEKKEAATTGLTSAAFSPVGEAV